MGLWLVVCVLLAAAPCVAEEITTKVGSFTVRTKLGSAAQDSAVIAIAMPNGGLIAMICSLDKLSISIASSATLYKAGAAYDAKIRVDDKLAVKTQGVASSTATIKIVDDAEKIINQIAGAKAVAVEIAGTSLRKFRIPLRKSAQAAELVMTACGKHEAKGEDIQ
jgi:hypothetical protein